MDSNEHRIQKYLVVNGPGQPSEVIARPTASNPGEAGLSPGTLAIMAILAIGAVAVFLYTIIH